MTDETVSPSKYSHRPNVIQNHVSLTTNESQRIQSIIPYRRSLTSSGKIAYDLYGIHLPKTSPIFVYVSGGYWSELSGDISAYPVGPLVSSQILTAILHYERAPIVKMDEILRQVLEGLLDLLDLCVANDSFIIAGGHSAGCQLLSLSLTNVSYTQLPDFIRNKIKAVVHFSGVFDLIPLLPTYVNHPLGLTIQEALTYSPRNHVLKIPPEIQTFIFLAEHECPVLKEQSKEYADALHKCGKRMEFQVVESVDHFDLVEKLSSFDYEITQRLISLFESLSIREDNLPL